MLNDADRAAICAEVARLLREERGRQGLSLNALSQKAGLSRQMVSYVEQQERQPTLDTLLRLSEALELRLDEMLRAARARIRP